MGYLKYKGYAGSAEFSEEDNCLFGNCEMYKNVKAQIDVHSLSINGFGLTEG